MDLASDRLVKINDAMQSLPDDMTEVNDDIISTFNAIILGLIAFKGHFDTVYDPFKPMIEKRFRNGGDMDAESECEGKDPSVA